MLAEFVQELLKLKRPETVSVEGRAYATSPLHAMADPMADAVKVGTLTGLVDLYRADLDKVKTMSVAVHVQSHTQVSIIGLAVNDWAKRRYYVQAVRPESRDFEFNEWLAPERFIIGLQSMFFPSDDLTMLLGICSTISAESVSVSEDDGITQKATFGRSVAFKENKPLKPIVELQPYRTFGEVEQPSSKFLFRVRQVMEGKAVQCMLTEADGGLWRQQAMHNMKQWFEARNLDLPIIS